MQKLKSGWRIHEAAAKGKHSCRHKNGEGTGYWHSTMRNEGFALGLGFELITCMCINDMVCTYV